MEEFEFIIAKSETEFSKGKELFIEYAETKKFNLEFQNFSKELEEIQFQYGFPTGGLFLIKDIDKNYIGCGGLRKFKNGVAEIKRMYIKNEFRGKGLGKKLLEKLIKLAYELKYDKIWLDTLESLQAATHIYREFGFKEQKPYRYNPNPDVLYFELILDLSTKQPIQ